MKTINYSTQLLYKDEKKEWPSFVFNILINGESFEYRLGLGYTDKKTGKVKSPRIGEVLHCLFFDARCADTSFENFCSDLGYNNDSIKALKTYLACQESGKKLRKALKERYVDIEKQVQQLEL